MISRALPIGMLPCGCLGWHPGGRHAGPAVGVAVTLPMVRAVALSENIAHQRGNGGVCDQAWASGEAARSFMPAFIRP